MINLTETHFLGLTDYIGHAWRVPKYCDEMASQLLTMQAELGMFRASLALLSSHVPAAAPEAPRNTHQPPAHIEQKRHEDDTSEISAPDFDSDF